MTIVCKNNMKGYNYRTLYQAFKKTWGSLTKRTPTKKRKLMAYGKATQL